MCGINKTTFMYRKSQKQSCTYMYMRLHSVLKRNLCQTQVEHFRGIQRIRSDAQSNTRKLFDVKRGGGRGGGKRYKDEYPRKNDVHKAPGATRICDINLRESIVPIYIEI